MDSLYRHRVVTFIVKNWFSLFLSIFICGFFWAPTTKILNNIYYGFILLPLVVLFCVRDNRMVKMMTFIKSYRWFFVFVVVLLVSSLLNGIDTASLGKQLTRVLYIVGLLAAIKVVVQNQHGVMATLLPLVMMAITLASCYSIYIWWQAESANMRMEGYGITENSVRLGAIYGFASVAALIVYLKGKDKKSWLYLIPAALALIVAFSSQSRGPLLASGVACTAALIVMRGHRSWLVGAVCLVAFIIFVSTFQESRLLTIQGMRPAIWQATMDKVILSPWFGYGLHAAEAVTVNNSVHEHPHGGYITTLFFGGIVGLTGLLILIATTALKEWNNPGLTPWRILLFFGLVYMLFDGSRLFYHPRELWLIFWMPMGFLMALATPKIEF